MPRRKAEPLPPVERVCVRLGDDGVARRVPTPPDTSPRQVDALGQPRLMVLCTCGKIAEMLFGGGLAPHDHVEFDPGPSTAFNRPPRSPEAEARLQALIAGANKPKTGPTMPPAESLARDVGLLAKDRCAAPSPAKAQPPAPPKRPSVRSTADKPEPELGDPQDPYLGA
jgi:hypothetical protein